MLASAVNLARRDSSRAAPEDGSGEHDPGWVRLLLAGLVVGVMTGFFGVGGGFIIVPALALFVGLPTRKAVATSLVVIVINCTAGLAGHLTLGSGISRNVLMRPVAFGIGGTIGSFGGARLAGRWPDRTLSRIFATIITGVAIYLLVRNLPGSQNA